jgi:hypothetical protein
MAKTKKAFIQFLIDPRKKEELMSKAQAEGKTVTDVLLSFVEKYLTQESVGNVDILELQRRIEALERESQDRKKMLGELCA